MKKTWKYIIIVLILFVLDIALTSIYLNKYYGIIDEGNPLAIIHQGYIILIVNIVYFLVILLLGKFISNYESIYVDASCGFDYFIKLYKSEHYKFIFVSLATSFIYATIFSRLTVVIDWIIFAIYTNNYFNTSYYYLKSVMPFSRFDILVGVLVFLLCIPIWYKLEYNKVNNL